MYSFMDVEKRIYKDKMLLYVLSMLTLFCVYLGGNI